MAYCPGCGTPVDGTDAVCSSCRNAHVDASTIQPLDRRATMLLWALRIGVVLTLIAVVSNLAEAALLKRIADGEGVSFGQANSNDERQGLIGLAGLALFIATAVLWLRWFSRAYKNLPGLGATGLRFGAGWAVGAWFVPFLNLVRPKNITDDIWRASDPEAPPFQGEAWKDTRAPALVNAWWAMFIISGLLARLTFSRFDSENQSIDALRSANSLTTVADLLQIPLAVLAILVVQRITERQELRTRMLRERPTSA